MTVSSPPDAITVQVVGNHLLSVSEEMGVTLMRTSYSPNIKERLDYSTAIFDARGQVIAQAQRIPIHLGSMLGVVEVLLKRYGKDQIRDGDMFLANDPYNGGGTHLPDFNLIAPVFVAGELRAFVANVAHQSDVGGMVVGSESGDCRDIFQEGLRIPLVRLIQGGELNSDIFDLVLSNTRLPHDRKGDVGAQIAANRVGIRGVQSLYERYGADVIAAAMDAQLDYAERRIRAAIQAIEDGDYFVADHVDDDGSTGTPVELCLRMTCRDDRLTFDFTGSGPAVQSARNVPFNALRATTYALVRMMLDADVPSNAGYYRAIDVIAEAGSILHAQPPSATSVRTSTCFVVGDMVAAALSEAIPTKATAGSGANAQIIPSGLDPATGELFVDYESFAGGLGARVGRDGIDAAKAHVGGSSNLPLESLEMNFPLRLERYELVEDSGGPGRWRGGLGMRRDYRILVDNAETVVFGQRLRIAPPGLQGGEPGRVGAFVLNPQTPNEQRLPPMQSGIPLARGDLLRVETAGGGGIGNPLERDPELVRADVAEGKVSASSARSDYAVSVVGGAVDQKETALLRGQ